MFRKGLRKFTSYNPHILVLLIPQLLMKKSLLLLLSTFFFSQFSLAQEAEEPKRILFTNVNVFDGVSDSLSMNTNVLVEDNLIAAVGPSITLPEGTEVIDGGGRTLMPGLIDSHTHLYATGGLFSSWTDMQNVEWDQMPIAAAVNATDYLYDGYTTLRDVGGMGTTALQKMIDAGIVEGPRIYTSGAFISATSGHGDFRFPQQRVYGGSSEDQVTQLNLSYVANGEDAVRDAARVNLSNGAHFLKLMVGGGISSTLDPLWSLTYTQEEIEAAVEAAAGFDTYVTVHAYDDPSVNRSLDAGVKVIEHGHLISEETVQRIVDEGVFWSLNTAAMDPSLLTQGIFAVPPARPKLESFLEGSANVANLIKQYRPKIVLNTDTVFSLPAAARSHRDFEKHFHASLLGNHPFLVAATSTGGELAQLTARRNPYPNKLGIIEKDAYADILIVDGNPLEDLSVLGADPKWFDAEPRDQGIETIRLIMKGGTIYKNTL